jgi:hypothetical protein
MVCMYVVMVLALTIVAPVVSVIVELAATGSGSGSGFSDMALLAGKWFTFWGVGVRLFSAGVSQTIRPDFTARTILGGGTDKGANLIVQELGFANLAIGLVGILSLPLSGWVVPAALAGGLFLGLAGIRHIAKPGKNTKEWLATVSDLVVSVVVLAFVLFSWATAS